MEERRLLVLVELDPVAVLVDGKMVTTAQDHGVSQGGLAALGPVHDVVALDKQPVRASWEPTRLIAVQQRTPASHASRRAVSAETQVPSLINGGSSDVPASTALDSVTTTSTGARSGLLPRARSSMIDIRPSARLRLPAETPPTDPAELPSAT